MAGTGSVSRYRGGEVRLVPYQTHGDETQPINVNDLCGFDGTYVWPASHWATAAAFYAAFCGVAVSKIGLQSGEKSFRLDTDPDYLLVAESGDFAFDCATGIAWTPNSLAAVKVTAGACEKQKVELASNIDTAIGIARLSPKQLGVTTLTEVIVQIAPRYRFAQVDSGV